MIMSDQEDEREEREEEEKPAVEMAKVMGRLAQALEGMRRERVPTHQCDCIFPNFPPIFYIRVPTGLSILGTGTTYFFEWRGKSHCTSIWC